jgi:6-phospho-3-hexuloisomerase
MKKIDKILAEIQSVTNYVDDQQLDQVASFLQKGKRIFVIGEGRSGLMAKSFAMRLMHLGATVYVIGETITPSISEGDVLVAVSGSGTTKNVVWAVEKAKEIHCLIIAITTNPESPLAAHASAVVEIPAATKYRRENEMKSIQPLGSLFDQCAHIVFDTICLTYAEKQEVDHEKAFHKHSNME